MKHTLPKFLIGFLMLYLASATAWAQQSTPYAFIETFENLGLTGNQYRDGTFVGNNGITWTYTHVSGEQAFPIDGAGMLLRRSGDNSHIKSELITGGISNFQVLMRKAFTGAGDRQIGLFINDRLIAESIVFGGLSGGSDDIFAFAVDNIDVAGDFTLEIRHLSGGTANRQLVIDDIRWNSFDGPAMERVAAPQFSPQGGSYTSTQNINIATSTESARIYYTLDGTDPTTESNLYTYPLPVATTTVLKAIASKDGMADSEVSEAEYVIHTANSPAAGIPYQQHFSLFSNFTTDVTAFGESLEWTFSGNILSYGGDFGTGTPAGLRGNGVVGYQHTGSSGIFTSTLVVSNTTAVTIQDLEISYRGLTERLNQTRFPAFTVTVNGYVVPELGYSTQEGSARTVSHTIQGINILPGQEVEISWSSDRGLSTTGGSRQIGLTEVSVIPVISEAPVLNVEDFNNISLGTGYTNGSFVGNSDIIWNYVASRNEGDFPIDGKGLMLRGASYESKITSSAIPGGIGSFSMDLRKAFTGGADRQVALLINGEEIARSEIFGGFSGADATIRTFEVNDIHLGGDIVIEIRNLTEGQITIDNITWTPFEDNFPPVISSLSPANGDQEIDSNADLSITFDERIIKGQGNIILYDTNGSPVQTIAISSELVSIDGHTASIALSELAQASTFYVLIDAGAFEDRFGNPSGGIESPEQWVFTTFDPNAPLITVNREALDNFGRISSGQASASQTFALTLTNVSAPISVSAPINFEVGIDGIFSNELILDPAESGTSETHVQVRFTPNSGTNQSIEGDLIISSDGAVSRSVRLIGDEIGNQITIAAARLLPNGTEVFVEGIVVAGSTLNPDNRWIQDATGGIMLRAFSNTLENGVERSADLNVGDSVRISGTLATFNQNIQISAGAIGMERLAANTLLPEPLTISIADISNPAVQGRLVRVDGLSLSDPRILFEGAGALGSYTITGQSGSRILRIPTADHPVVGNPIPDKTFDAIGIVDRFNATAQLNPRFQEDIILDNAAGSIAFSEGRLNFGLTASGEVSPPLSYSFMINQPAATLNLSAEGPFELSIDGESFAKTVSLDDLGIATQEVLVRFVPTAFANGIRNGFILHSGGQIYRSIVQLHGIESGNTTAIPYAQNFNTPDVFTAGGWSDYNVRGAQGWQITADGTGVNNTGRAAQMNGFSNGAQENENWMISPLFNLDSDKFPVLSFYSRSFFSGPRLQLKASANYDGFSDPTLPQFTWIDLEDKFAVSTGSFVLADNIDLSDFNHGQLHLAFVYLSDQEVGAAEWRVDDFNIRLQDEQPRNLLLDIGPLSNMHFGIVTPGEISEAKSFNFTATGLADQVTLSIAAPFLISKNGTDFSSEISFLPGEPFRSAVQVKYAPVSIGVDVASVQLTSGGITSNYGRFTGSTKGKENTFDVVSWNIEWFGSSTSFQGPSNVNLQLQNVKTIIEDLDADVYAFQEITDLDKFYELAEALPEYRGFHSSAVSQVGDFSEAQKLTYLYKTTTVDSISSRVLLQGVDVNLLTGYPSTRDRFWASGRLPFLFDIKTKINGVAENITLVNVHTRSNGGGESAANPRYAMRKYDVNVMKDSLDLYYSNVPLIILGDFNDDLDETVADQSAATVNTSKTSFIDYINDSLNYTPATISLSNAGLRTFIAFENVIDHMIISNEIKDKWLPGSERVVIPFDLVQNYANTTSDHLPIKVRFELKCHLEAGVIIGNDEVCAGANEVQLTMVGGLFDSIGAWERSVDGGNSWITIGNSEGRATITVANIAENTLYRVGVEGSSCSAIYTEPLEVKIKTLEVPFINFEKGKLVTLAGDYTYTWYKDGKLVATTLDNEIRINGAGNYLVEIRNEEGCAAVSPPYKFPQVPLKNSYKIFPNPSSKKVFVSIEENTGLHRIELRNAMGLLIKSYTTDKNKVEFDVSSLYQGVYLIMITDNFGNHTVERLLVK
ncbi:chitobiase/beta-hexosaminidase C-terminal domain-containing protein [Anditalea andensis]|uniref:Por secretion system C-terminal sorting domain-containing protein n=1 Tax=Anditalea andensis TaxID=1048983 RepID=A0A074KST0_9BACT|nr:chitobiase/beta-hexosaminidase C-terminal domain-containing protein [Anditalea andensis]KEO71979.1 hypothetical protein EL17_20920 [Anditalea andensis]